MNSSIATLDLLYSTYQYEEFKELFISTYHQVGVVGKLRLVRLLLSRWTSNELIEYYNLNCIN